MKKVEKTNKTFHDNMSKAEKELEDDYYCFLLKIIMYNLKQLSEDNYLPNIDKKIDEINEKITTVLNIYRKDDHKRFVRYAINRYLDDFNEVPNEYQVSIIDDPSKFNMETIRRELYVESIDDFISYWDEQISMLIQKSAIRKRREYLIERCKNMITLCNKHNYNELSLKIKKYKLLQILILENQN